MMKRREVLALGLATLSARALTPAFAQPRYPDRPIRLVIPFPPGGVYDAVGRPYAERMKTALGTVIVENQGGAGGSLGAAAVAQAQPDGYTILLGGGGPLVVNPIAQHDVEANEELAGEGDLRLGPPAPMQAAEVAARRRSSSARAASGAAWPSTQRSRALPCLVIWPSRCLAADALTAGAKPT